jgi:hypothetical protein
VASKLSLFLAELKRRKVYHVAAAYVATGAVLIGLADGLLPESTWESLKTPVAVLILIGFPIALILAWAYEVKPEEPERPSETEPTPVASSLVLAGDEEAAFEWVTNAVDRGFINYLLLAEHDPFLSSFRGEPRYEALLGRVSREWETFEV